jgi:hypothetical protein
VSHVFYVFEPTWGSGLDNSLANSHRSAAAGLLYMTDTAGHDELAPAEKEELHRLSEEYRVATSCVLKALNVGNPIERVAQFLAEAERAAEIVARIKAILNGDRQ